jgi:hypothetical protein
MSPEPIPTREAPAVTLLQMLRGYWVSQAIFAAAQLGIADLLEDGPRSCAELAVHTGVPARSLQRLLRALAGIGVFAEVEGETYGLTPLASCLRTDAPGSLRASGIVTGELLYPAWGDLLQSLRTGEPTCEHVFGAGFFAHLTAHPEVGARFQDMMADQKLTTNAAVPAAYDFSGCGTIVDVGGGNGSLIASILAASPASRGILFELPHVLDQARRQLLGAGVVERCEVVGGDFFASVPAGGDAYLLRSILHDYGDERAARILRSCRAAMPMGGRLLVIEQVVPDVGEPGDWMTKFMDLQMLILLGGQERTEAEFRELFVAAGFRLRRVIPTRSPVSILEGIPG